MKKVLIVTEEKYSIALLNNSKLLNYKSISKINGDVKNELLKFNVTILDKLKFKDDFEYDIIIIDDLSNYNEENKNILYYFIEPIDFNISDPFITNRWPEALLNSTFKNKVEWANNRFSNLIFLGSNLFESPNQIFDLSLVLNLNNNNDNWGKYHYLARDLFKSIRRKPYRIDYSFREVKKENRVKLFLELTQHLRKEEKIKISAHGGFFNDENYYNDVKNFFEKSNMLSTFLEFEKVEKRFFSFDELKTATGGYSVWPINKLFNNTFSSDISFYFETAREREMGILNTMNHLITEKTIDLLTIGKPFYNLSSNVDLFLEKFGFINYKTKLFNRIHTDVISLAHEICNMDEIQYDKLYNNLMYFVEANIKKLDEYYKNNTFLFNLIHN